MELQNEVREEFSSLLLTGCSKRFFSSQFWRTCSRDIRAEEQNVVRVGRLAWRRVRLRRSRAITKEPLGERKQVKAVLLGIGCIGCCVHSSLPSVPVFISDELSDLYYNGFSNEVLWPLFHYIVDQNPFETKYWEAYKVTYFVLLLSSCC